MKYLSIILVLFIGCARYQPPQRYNVKTEAVIEKPFEKVWTSAVEWFATHNTPIKNMDKTSGFISTEYSLSANDLNCLDCGVEGQAFLTVIRIENQRGNFNLIIKPLEDGNTKVLVNCFYKATYNMYSEGRLQRSEEINCTSTGVLERAILRYLNES